MNWIKLDSGMIINLDSANLFKIEKSKIIVASMGFYDEIDLTKNDYKNIYERLGIKND